jgi:alpha-tubulin suppressor-like RCC1 family protein
MVTDAGMDAGMDALVDSAVDAPVDAPIDAAPDAAVLPPALYASGGVTRSGAYLDGTHFMVWGSTDYGEAGLISPTPVGPTEVMVPGGTISAYAVGGSHLCALTDQIYCWGRNDDERLGRPFVTIENDTPAPLTTSLTGIVGLSLGFAHSCAWSASEVHCWGSNFSGQLGEGAVGGSTEVPRTATLGGAVARVVAGDQHTCAIRSDQMLYCWGRNSSGELGDGTRMDRPTPVAVPIGAVKDVAVGRSHTCAAHPDGSLTCFGSNLWGELGRGTMSAGEDPAVVPGLGSVNRVTVGYDHTCALLDSGPIF